MDMELKEEFIGLWKKYFGDTELPITFYYTDEEGHGEMVKPNSTFTDCIIGKLSKVRNGKSLCFNGDSIGCPGGKKYVGFNEDLMPGFEYFLSCGIPGKMEGERYKKTPELVMKYLEYTPSVKPPGKFIVFKRWDMLEESDNPKVAIFFAKPDVLSGLFTLANFDEAELNEVYAPMGPGCGTAILYPYLENDKERPRCVLGMFDVSARPFVPKDILSFAIPMVKFITMIKNMEESFFITESWSKVQKRITDPKK